MTENPFASPALSAAELDARDTPRNLRGLFIMAMVGPCVGGLVIGIAGAVTASAIAVLAGVMGEGPPIPMMREGPEIVFSCGIFGFFFAGAGGVPLGLIMGLVAGSTRPRFRHALHMTCMLFTILLALPCSALESAILSESLGPVGKTLMIGLSLIVGGLGGALGGHLLGRLLGNLAWGVEQKAAEPISTEEHYE